MKEVMEEEIKSLSEKKRIPFDCIPDKKSFYFYPEEDVKEFIEKLTAEEHIKRNWHPKTFIITEEELIKLLGKELMGRL